MGYARPLFVCLPVIFLLATHAHGARFASSKPVGAKDHDTFKGAGDKPETRPAAALMA